MLSRKISTVFICLFILNTGVYSQNFETRKTVEGIEILENGKKVLFYQVKPQSVDGKYERSGYVHPLYSLNETVLTEDMPADHLYHRGIFWAWHQIILNNKSIADGWISDRISWKPGKLKVKKSDEELIIRSELIWNAELEEDKPTAIVKEKTKITVFKATPQYRLLDFEINLFALKDNLKIGGSDDHKGYGGFSLRLKLPGDITFVSDNKIVIPTEEAVLAGPWMDFKGSFDSEIAVKSGIAVFISGTGRTHPWILRKAKSMQNVPFPGRTPVELSKRGLRLKYRVLIHNAELSNEEIEELYQQYIQKP